MIKSYDEVVDYICGCRRFGSACGKEVTEEFLQLLQFEKPEEMHIFHIAGTNGKGSTVAFLSAILRELSVDGKPAVVGTFTSPHLVSFTERIAVNGIQISEEDAARIGAQLIEDAKKLSNAPTMFDYCTVMALLYFKECGCNFVVLETGLGGELDSTNASMLEPEVAVITSIGLEHTNVLGNNLKTIARAKAGIIKPSQLVVYGDVPAEAEAVIFARAMAYGIFATKAKELSMETKLGLFGAYQRKNAATAVAAIKVFFSKNVSLADGGEDALDKAIENGLMAARWPGRMEIISENPFVMLDGAHNPQGAEALRDSLKEAYEGEEFCFIVGVMADKDYRAIMRRLSEVAHSFYCVTVDNDRSMAAKELSDMLNESGYKAFACDDIADAIERARIINKKIIVCGSLYFIGECEKSVKKILK